MEATSTAQSDQSVKSPFEEYQDLLLPPASTYRFRDETVVVDGGEIIVRSVIPVVDNESETFPVLVHVHGGGRGAGNIDLDDFFLRKLSVDLKLSTVNVKYRLAPEYQFTTALNDCMAALKWIAQNTPLLKADLTKGFLVGGHSAGANLAAVVAHAARDDPFFTGPGRQLTGQIIREPLVIHSDVHPDELKPFLQSMKENADVLYPSHAGVPRAFVQGMEPSDPPRDDAREYARALRAAGIVVRHIEYPDPGINPAAGVKVHEDLLQGIRWLLEEA
ncbi:hypothetical protein VTO73DRAFT_11621 [Trametes versicolor]